MTKQHNPNKGNLIIHRDPNKPIMIDIRIAQHESLSFSAIGVFVKLLANENVWESIPEDLKKELRNCEVFQEYFQESHD